MDLPKKPVPPITKSVDITFYLCYQAALQSGEAQYQILIYDILTVIAYVALGNISISVVTGQPDGVRIASVHADCETQTTRPNRGESRWSQKVWLCAECTVWLWVGSFTKREGTVKPCV